MYIETVWTVHTSVAEYMYIETVWTSTHKYKYVETVWTVHTSLAKYTYLETVWPVHPRKCGQQHNEITVLHKCG